MRPIPDDLIAELPWFWVARAINILVWVNARRDNPGIAAYADRSLERALALIEEVGA